MLVRLATWVHKSKHFVTWDKKTYKIIWLKYQRLLVFIYDTGPLWKHSTEMFKAKSECKQALLQQLIIKIKKIMITEKQKQVEYSHLNVGHNEKQCFVTYHQKKWTNIIPQSYAAATVRDPITCRSKARLNIQKLCILPTQCICVFRVVLTINSDCFPK
jgi:hypothetical protein